MMADTWPTRCLTCVGTQQAAPEHHCCASATLALHQSPPDLHQGALDAGVHIFHAQQKRLPRVLARIIKRACPSSTLDAHLSSTRHAGLHHDHGVLALLPEWQALMQGTPAA